MGQGEGRGRAAAEGHGERRGRRGGRGQRRGRGRLRGQGRGQESTDQKALPAMPLPIACFCCLLNCAIPGCGTILAGLCCSKDDKIDGKPTWKINCITGIAQFITSLCFFGILWSWMWGLFMILKRPACNENRVDNNAVVTQQPQSTGQITFINQSTGVPFIGKVVNVGGVTTVIHDPAASTGLPAGPPAFNTLPGIPMVPEVHPPPAPPQYSQHQPIQQPVFQQHPLPPPPAYSDIDRYARTCQPAYTTDDPAYSPGVK